MPRAGPLRYWSFTIVGGVIVLASLAVIGWGTYELIGTDSCGTRTTQACDSDTGLHILAVTLGPFVGFAGGALLVFRGGTSWRWGRRQKRVADMVARGQMQAPTVARPTGPPTKLPEGPPTTWRPAVSAPEPDSPVERLQKLDALKAKGLIDVADYETQKKRILGGA